MAQTKVLVVEDEPNARAGLAELIASWGYRTETAADGAAGRDSVLRWSPDVVVTDRMMPRMDGLQLLDRISDLSQQVAVVVATKKPGYVIILDETPDGKLTQIYPNGFSSRALPRDHKQTGLEPGRDIIVPDPQNPYAGFVYVVDKTVGEGMISVFQSEDRKSVV